MELGQGLENGVWFGEEERGYFGNGVSKIPGTRKGDTVSLTGSETCVGTASKTDWSQSQFYFAYSGRSIEDSRVGECSHTQCGHLLSWIWQQCIGWRKETQGKETVVISQVWCRAQTGIVARKKKMKEWISGMLKEDPTGFGYFKIREREKPKMSFEILIC